MFLYKNWAALYSSFKEQKIDVATKKHIRNKCKTDFRLMSNC